MIAALFPGDCAIRALSQALRKPYLEVHEELYSPRGVHNGVIIKYAKRFATVSQEPTLSKTLGQFTTLHPVGTYLVFQPQHVVAVVDGVALDWAKHTRRKILSVWRIKMSDPLSTAAEAAPSATPPVDPGSPPTVEPDGKPSAPKKVKFPGIPEKGLTSAEVPAEFDPKLHLALRESDFENPYHFWEIKIRRHDEQAAARRKVYELKLSETRLYADLPGTREIFMGIQKHVNSILKLSQELAAFGPGASQSIDDALGVLKTQMGASLFAKCNTDEQRASVTRLLDNVVELSTATTEEE